MHTTSCMFLFLCVYILKLCHGHQVSDKNANMFDVEGTIYPPDIMPSREKLSWLTDTKVYLKGGHYIGFLKEDGSFTISKVAPGSYIVEVISGNYVYEPIRVDINIKGKFRARRINYIQNSQISPLPYPLRMKSVGPARYFQIREQWRLIDLLFNPMVLMMLLPFACIMLLPHVLNDPEAKKEMEQFQNMAKYDVPEVSEMIASFFSNNKDKQLCRPSKSGKRDSKSKSNH